MKTETGEMTNKEFAEKDAQFILICKSFKIKPTKRQASKFRRGKGIASISMRCFPEKIGRAQWES